ncbi:hypothetical protein F4809DRAFT_610441 [Biscogniauxia mediterranea]|nr:hypothetical protein F4809DRAFT_610441 [Biscogniauxia mediterranea]
MHTQHCEIAGYTITSTRKPRVKWHTHLESTLSYGRVDQNSSLVTSLEYSNHRCLRTCWREHGEDPGGWNYICNIGKLATPLSTSQYYLFLFVCIYIYICVCVCLGGCQLTNLSVHVLHQHPYPPTLLPNTTRHRFVPSSCLSRPPGSGHPRTEIVTALSGAR